MTVCDRFNIDILYTLNNNNYSPKAISHKELNSYLAKAKKESNGIRNLANKDINDNQEFDQLICEWTTVSKKILTILQQKEMIATKKTDPKALLAFGAMGAHINMALHALKATEFE